MINNFHVLISIDPKSIGLAMETFYNDLTVTERVEYFQNKTKYMLFNIYYGVCCKSERTNLFILTFCS